MSTNEIIPRRPKAIWLNREYMLLWSGQVVSSVGTQVSQLAFPLLILALTGSIAATSIQRRFHFGQVIIGTTWISALILPLYAIAPNPFILGVLSRILVLSKRFSFALSVWSLSLYPPT